MSTKKRLPPMRRKLEKREKNQEDFEDDRKIMEDFNKTNLVQNNCNNNFEIPEFLKKADNEQYLQMFINMRQRHIADGAVSINVETDDIADQNFELYDNKGINIEPPIMNENLADNVEYFVELCQFES